MNILKQEQTIVRRYLGIQYKLRGRDYRTGLDCYGLIIAVYKDLGFDLLDIEEEYDINWQWQKRVNFIEKYHDKWLKVKSAAFLDVVLFKDPRGHANHGGIMLRDDRFLHCSKTGVTIGRIMYPQWESRVDGFYHLKVRDD